MTKITAEHLAGSAFVYRPISDPDPGIATDQPLPDRHPRESS